MLVRIDRVARMNSKAPGVVVTAADSREQGPAPLLQVAISAPFEHAGRERADTLSEAVRRT